MAKVRHDDTVEACGEQRPDSSHEADIDEGQRFETTANVGLVVGIAGAVAGTIMILVGDNGDQVQAAPRPGGAWFSYRASF